ncbi:MAG: aspartate aminotransferase family protein [Betaproteobacteria bacterium]|nr:aspartate aminotransferase family protein [Betaproteobacteria bacterium]
MSKVFHRNPLDDYPVAVGGDGAYLIDAHGKRYLDACGGAAVSCLGHSDRTVIEAIQQQLERLAFAHTSFFTNEPMEALAEELIRHSPPEMERVYFVSGGSEAMEAALKLARQYFIEVGQPRRRHIIARRQSYHGNTLGALAVGGNAARRKQFEPLLIEATHVSPCYAYRGRQPGEAEEQYGERLAQELESRILALGADSVIAFVAETVGGATIGTVPPVPGYFRRMREVCDRHGVLLILDEVMCGMGRCGSLFAFEQEGIVPDLVAIAKGLGAGYQAIGAVIASRKIYQAVVSGSGFFQHGHTYLGHAAACAGALAVHRRLYRGGLLERVTPMGRMLESKLRAAFEMHVHVGDIRGRGLFWTLELVEDRVEKEPFDPKRKLNAQLKKAALAEGLMCYPMGGTVDGTRGDHVLFAPPFIIEPAQLDELVEKFSRALDVVLNASFPPL